MAIRKEIFGGRTCDVYVPNESQQTTTVKKPFIRPADEQPSASASSTVTSSNDFMAVCRSYASANKVSLGTAIKTLARERPELHQAWLRDIAINGKRPQR
jgi:hypothetical protein